MTIVPPMKTTYTLAAVVAAVILAAGHAMGEPTAAANPAAADARLAATAPGEWSFSATAYVYVVPGDRDYVQPTFTADRNWLHLEARYNYEDLETGSAWVGYNFAFGERLAVKGTAMLGGVFGKTTGIAP